MASKFKLPKTLIGNLFIDALEGGSNYWLGELPSLKKKPGETLCYSERFFEHICNGETLHVVDDEGEEEGDINIEKVNQAIDMMKTKYPTMYREIRDEEYDGGTADVFLQLCLFGEIIFG